MNIGIYYTLYGLLNEFIYGVGVLSESQELTLTLICTIGTLFVVALPFIVVWRLIRLFL